jgi:LPS export ABC transporter protein LptC
VTRRRHGAGTALAAGLLALAAGCGDQGMRPSASLAVADSADQVLYRMSTRVLDEGLQRSHVVAETAFVYQARQVMDLRQLRMTFFDEQGRQTSVLTARQGMYTIGNQSLDARGDVVVETTEGRRLRTEHLVYDRGAMQIRSDTAFTYVSPSETLTGDGFTSDLEFRNVIVDRPRGRQRTGGVALPEG